MFRESRIDGIQAIWLERGPQSSCDVMLGTVFVGLYVCQLAINRIKNRPEVHCISGRFYV